MFKRRRIFYGKPLIKSYGEWKISITSNLSIIPNSGGECTITPTASREVYWSNRDVTIEYAEPQVIGTSHGVINGYKITFDPNHTTKDIEVKVTASIDDVADTILVSTQDRNRETYIEYGVPNITVSYPNHGPETGDVIPSGSYTQSRKQHWESSPTYTTTMTNVTGEIDDSYTTYSGSVTNATLNIVTGQLTWTANMDPDNDRSNSIIVKVSINGMTSEKIATAVQEKDFINEHICGDVNINLSNYDAVDAKPQTSNPINFSYYQIRTYKWKSGNVTTNTNTVAQSIVWNITGVGVSINQSGILSWDAQSGNTSSKLADVTVTVTMEGGKVNSKSVKASQHADYKLDKEFLNPNITTFYYSICDAAGNVNINPTISYNQIVNQIWYSDESNAGTRNGTCKATFSTNSNYCSVDPNTGALVWDQYVNEQSDRYADIVVKISGEGNKESTDTFKATQTHDGINLYTYDNPVISTYEYNDITAAGGTITPSISYYQIRTEHYISGKPNTTTKLTTGGALSYTFVENTNQDVTISQSTGVITWGSYVDETTNRNIIAKATVTMNNKSGYKEATATQTKDAYINTTWGEIELVEFKYAEATAASQTIVPTVKYSQTGVKNYISGKTGFTETYTASADDNYTNYESILFSGETEYGTLNGTTGSITWTANHDTSSGREVEITAYISRENNTKEVAVVAKQKKDEYTTTDWNNPIISTFSYPVKDANEGSVTPNIIYYQNGTKNYVSGNKVSTQVSSNKDDSYINYAIEGTASSDIITINTSTGVVTWKDNTGGERSYSIIATVNINGKSSSETAITTQSADALTNTTYSYSVPEVTSIKLLKDVPASGATVDKTYFEVTYKQIKTTTNYYISAPEGISHNSTLTGTCTNIQFKLTNSVVGDNLGTNDLNRTKIGTSKIKININDVESAEYSCDVYQQANKPTFIDNTLGAWIGDLTINNGSTLPANADERTITYGKVRRDVTPNYKWTSGSNSTGDTYVEYYKSPLGCAIKTSVNSGSSYISIENDSFQPSADNNYTNSATLVKSTYGTNVVSAQTYTISMVIYPVNADNAVTVKSFTISAQANVKDATNKLTAWGTPSITSLSYNVAEPIANVVEPIFAIGECNNTRTYYYTSGSVSKTTTESATLEYGWSVTGAATEETTNTGKLSWGVNTSETSTKSATVVLTVTNTANTSYKTSKTVTATQKADYITACGTPTISIGSGLTAGGGSTDISASVTNTWKAYGNKAGTVTLSITSNGNNRFSLSGTKLSHSTMGTNVTTDSVTVKAVNNGDSSKSATDSKSVENKRTVGAVTLNIGSGLTAAGGEATLSASSKDTYTSGAESTPTYTYSITHQSFSTSTTQGTNNSINRFSLSGTKLSHTSMGEYVGYDHVTVKATGSTGGSATKSTYIQNTVSSEITTWGTPTISIGSGLTAAGGSATITASVTNKRTYHYTSGDVIKDEAGTVTLSITSNGNNRFSLSGTKLSHSTMGTNVTTDSVTVKAVNSGDSTKSATDSKSIENKRTVGGITLTIGSGLTAAGGEATLSASSKDTYTSGAESTPTYTYSITHQSFSTSTTQGTNGNTSRFSLSGTKLSHTTMGENVGYDHVTVKVTGSTGGSATKSTYIQNTVTDSITSYGTPTISIGSGLTAAGGSATLSASATNVRTYYYTSGNVNKNEKANLKVEISSNGNSRFSLSGTTTSTKADISCTLKHSSMNTDVTTDTVIVKATNTGDTTKTSTITKSIINERTVGGITLTIGSGLTAAGGAATLSASSKDTYTSGAESTPTYTYSINNQYIATSTSATSGTAITRYSVSGSKLSHSSMTNNVGYDHVIVKVTGSTGGSTTKSTYIQNAADATNTITTWGAPVITIGSGLTAAGGEATVSVVVKNTRTYYYTSGTISKTDSNEVGSYTDLKITSNGNNRFSLSGTKLSHTTMGTSATTDTVTLSAANISSSDKVGKVSQSIVNKANASYDAPVITKYIYNEFAKGGATLSPTVTYTQQPYYTSGSKGTIISGNNSDSNSETFVFAFTNSNGFTLNSTSTGSMTASNNKSESTRKPSTLPSVKVTLNGKTSAIYTCTSCTQAAGTISYGAWTGGAVTISDSSTALPAAASSRTVTIKPWSRTKGWNSSTTDIGTEYYTGTVNVSENGNYTSLSATSYTASSSNKELTLTKTTCGTNVTEATTIKVTAVGPTTTTASINQVANIRTVGPIELTIGSGITAAGGAAALSAFATDTYTSGAESTPTFTYSINNQYIATSTTATSGTAITRYSVSGTTLSHSSMTNNVGYDHVIVKVTGSTGGSATKSTYIQNTSTVEYDSWMGGAISFNSTAALSAAADSRTVTIKPWSRKYRNRFTSGSANGESTEYYTGSVNVSENGDYTSLSATSYTASSSDKTLTLTKTTCGTTAVNAATITITANPVTDGPATTTATISQTQNKIESSSITTWGAPAITIGSGLTAAGGEATISIKVTNTRTHVWTANTSSVSAKTTTTEDGSYTDLKITSNGNSRFSLSGTKLSHTTMGQNLVTDTVTLSAANSGSTSVTGTASKSITNTRKITSYDNPVLTFNNYSAIVATGSTANASGSWKQNATYTYDSTATKNEQVTSGTLDDGYTTYKVTNSTGTATTTSGLSVDSASGKVTWSENQSESTRSGYITASTTVNGKTGTKTASTSQNAGSKSYSGITINSLAYGAVSAAGGSKSPSISYTQTWGWNGNTSNGGTINGGSGDDGYTSYAITDANGNTTAVSGLTLATDTGIATWGVYNPTSGAQDTTGRKANIKMTVSRNSKSASKVFTNVLVQNGETVSKTEYGEWNFTLTPSSTSIAATGGNVTMTLTRPTRSVKYTYDSGDTRTITESATTGTFAISRSNSSFTLSTTSVSMTSSTVPTFTLSVGATGAAAVSAISSTVTAAFTATSPTTGTTTKSVTSSSITRAASSLVSTAYQFSTYSVGTSTFEANGGTTTLSMVVQRQRTYTGSQKDSWVTITPADGSIVITCGTGASSGEVTEGTTSTSIITVGTYTTTNSNRSIKISANYSNGAATKELTLTQNKDYITAYGTPSTPTVGSGLTAAGGSATLSSTVSNTYKSGQSLAGSVTYELVHKSASSSTTQGTNDNSLTIFSLSGSTLSHTGMGTNIRYDHYSVRAKNAGDTSKVSSNKSGYIQNTRTLSSVYLQPYQPDNSWIVTVSGSGQNVTWGTCPATGGYVKMRGYANYTHTSGSNLNDQQITIDASVTWSGSPSWITTHTNGGYKISENQTESSRSSNATWSYTYGGVTKTSAAKSISQAAGVKTYGSWSGGAISFNSTSALSAGADSRTVTIKPWSRPWGWNGNNSNGGTQYYTGKVTVSENGSYTSLSSSSYTASSSNATLTLTKSTCGDTEVAAATITVTANPDTDGPATTTASISQTANIAKASSKITTYGTPTSQSIGSGITAAGGSATLSASVSNTKTWYWTSGATHSTETVSGTVGYSVNSQYIATSTTATSGTAITRYSVSGSKLSHTTMANNVGYDHVVVKFYNTGDSSKYVTKSTYVQNAANASNKITTYGTPTVSIGSGITAGGGSATITRGVTNKRTYYYTSGTAGDVKNEAGTVNLSISHQSFFTSTTQGTNNNITRYSLSGTTLSHGSMTSNVGYDHVTVTATNAGSTSLTKTASTYVRNAANASNKITTYGTPTVSIGSGITAGGGSATITRGVTNKRTYYYTSGTAGDVKNEAGTVNLSISHQSFSTSTTQGTNNNIARYSLSGTTLSHSSMTSNVGYDHVTVKATNAGSTSLTKTASTYVRNIESKVTDSTSWNNVSVTKSSNGISAGGGTCKLTASQSGTRYYHHEYTSGTKDAANAHNESVTNTSFTWTETTDNNSRYSISATSGTSITVTHSTMGANATTDNCTITCTGSGSKTGTASWSIQNTESKVIDSTSWNNVSVTKSSNGISAGGGTCKLTASQSGTRYYHHEYTSGSKDKANAHSESVSNTSFIWSKTTDNNSRYRISATSGTSITVTHSTMGTNVTTDNCTITCTGSGSKTGTASWSIRNTESKVIDSTSWNNPTNVSIGSGITAAGGSATLSASQSGTRYYHHEYTSGSKDKANAHSESVSNTSFTWSERSDNNNRYSISGSTLRHSSMTTNETTDSVTVRCTGAGSKYTDVSKSVSNTKSISSYGNITKGSITNATVPASGGSATASAKNGSQTVYYTWSSGSDGGSGTISVTPSPSSLTKSGNHLGTTVTDQTTLGSTTVTWSNGGKSATGTMYVYQQENRVTSSTNTRTTYDGGGTSYGHVSAGSINRVTSGDIPAGGGSVKFSAGSGTQSWETSTTYATPYYKDNYTSGSQGSEYAGSRYVSSYGGSGSSKVNPDAWSKSVSANSLGTTEKTRTAIGSVTFTWKGNGGAYLSAIASSDTVYQAANTKSLVKNITGVSVSYRTAAYSGGTVTPSVSGTASQYYHYSSGSDGSSSSVSISGINLGASIKSGSGASVSNSSSGAINWGSNSSTSSRSVTVGGSATASGCSGSKSWSVSASQNGKPNNTPDTWVSLVNNTYMCSAVIENISGTVDSLNYNSTSGSWRHRSGVTVTVKIKITNENPYNLADVTFQCPGVTFNTTALTIPEGEYDYVDVYIKSTGIHDIAIYN